MAKKPDTEIDNLSKVATKFIPDHELRDPIAILFRKLLRVTNVNVSKWTTLLNSHLKWEINEKDPVKAKKMRGHQVGNIKSTFFKSYELTFQKLLAGLSILRMKECEIILRVKDHEGNVTEVSEKIRIASSFENRKKEEKSSE